MHWSDDYLGMRWEPYATGNGAFDCWGLVQHCLDKHYGVRLDRYIDILTYDHKAFSLAVSNEIKKGHWQKIEKPIDGTVVLMSQHRLFHHIGIFTNGVVLHSKDGADVCRETLKTLQKSGFKRIEFYIHERIAKSS